MLKLFNNYGRKIKSKYNNITFTNYNNKQNIENLKFDKSTKYKFTYKIENDNKNKVKIENSKNNNIKIGNSKNVFDDNLKHNTSLKQKKSLIKQEKYIYIMSDKYSIKPEKEICLFKNDKNKFIKEIHKYKKIDLLHIRDLIKKTTVKVFLPRDYPNSVREGYYQFSMYSMLCGVLFYIMNFLSTQALINSLGLTQSRGMALGLSAGMNWVLKDGIGQLGSIFFAAKFSNSIEYDLKKWRILSLWMYNFGILLDCLTLYKPEYFIIIASFATLFKLSAFIANSSTRTGLNYYFCKENNITDLTNKFMAQNNISFIFGNLFGLILSTSFSMKFTTIFPTIIVLSILHLIFAHYSIKNIYLNDLNLQRAYQVVIEYLNSKNIPDPSFVNKKEKIFFNKLKYFKFCNYHLEKVFKKEKDNKYIDDIVTIFKDNKYLVYVDKKYSYFSQKYIFTIYTFMKLDAENVDIFIAFIYALKINEILNKEGRNLTNLGENKVLESRKNSYETINENLINILDENLEWVKQINKKDLVYEIKEKGWDTNFHLLEKEYRRYHLLFK